MKAEKYKELLKQKRFKDLLEGLETEFILLYKEILNYKDVKYDENWNLTRLGCEVSKVYPSYLRATDIVDAAFYSGEYSYDEALDTILVTYESLKKSYKN